MKRYIVVCVDESNHSLREVSGPFTALTWPLRWLAVYGSRRMTRTIPDWPYRYEIQEARNR